MSDHTVAVIALVLSAGSLFVSWRGYRQSGANVTCLLDIVNFDFVVAVRNKGLASVQVRDIGFMVRNARGGAGQGTVYVEGERMPPTKSAEQVRIVMPRLISFDVTGQELGQAVPGLHTEYFTVSSSDVFDEMSRVLEHGRQRIKAAVVLGDGREAVSNWVGLGTG